MPSLLLVHASTHGQTAKIAHHLAQGLRAAGCEVAELEVADAGAFSVQDFDAVVVAGSVHGGRHQRPLVEWAKSRARLLNAMPSTLISVSLSAAEDSDEARGHTREMIDRFVEDTGWTPRHAEPVAGALRYREYNVPTRVLMRMIAQRAGHPEPDTHVDHEYTDWAALDALAATIAAEATAAVATA